MKILAIDTSSASASAAVVEDSRLLGEITVNNKLTHSQKIMVMIEELLKSLELDIEDIDLFAAANGPGSFTGLRIGVATIKALAYSTNKPAAGISTLAGLAYNLPYAEHIIVPIMDARNRRVYTASYIWDEDGFKELSDAEVTEIDECIRELGDMLDIIFVGDGALVYKDIIKERMGGRAHFAPASCVMQRASSVAMLAMEKAKNGEAHSFMELNPFYLNKSQAEREYDEKHGKGGKA